MNGEATKAQMLKEAGIDLEAYKKACLSVEEFIQLIAKEKKAIEFQAYKEVWEWIQNCGEDWAVKYPFEFYNQLKTYLELSEDIIESEI